MKQSFCPNAPQNPHARTPLHASLQELPRPSVKREQQTTGQLQEAAAEDDGEEERTKPKSYTPAPRLGRMEEAPEAGKKDRAPPRMPPSSKAKVRVKEEPPS